MAYQEKTTTSYGQRLSGSLKGIVFGFVMFLIGTVMLFKNGSFVKQKRSLNEAQSVTTHVSDLSGIDGSLNGKVIHATAFANTTDVQYFAYTVQSITLSRQHCTGRHRVDMYSFRNGGGSSW